SLLVATAATAVLLTTTTLLATLLRLLQRGWLTTLHGARVRRLTAVGERLAKIANVSTPPGDCRFAFQLLQRLDCGAHNIHRIVVAMAFGEHIADARTLHHGTHCTTGNNTGTGTGWLQQHAAGTKGCLDLVRNGAAI